MWRLPWYHADPNSATDSAARLVVVGLLALFALSVSKSSTPALALVACLLAFDFLCQHRGDGWAFARSVTAWSSCVLLLLFLLDTHHVLPNRWTSRTLQMDRGFWDAGHYWAPLTAQLVHRGWLDLGTNLIGLMLFGTRVEVLLGPRPFLGLILLAAVVTGFSMLLVQPPPRICGASGIVMAIAAAWPALLATRAGTMRLLDSDRLSGAFLFVLLLHLVAIAGVVSMHSRRGLHGALPLSVLCGVACVVRFRRLQKRRFERLLREFLARKRARQRRNPIRAGNAQLPQAES